MSHMLTPGGLEALAAEFAGAFGCAPARFFSAPGRVEIGGNHTDHQHGHVLAAAVNLDTRAAVRQTARGELRVQSAGFPLSRVSLSDLGPRASEFGTTTALVRGVAAWFAERGCALGGLDICVTSTVLPGSGLSSSAAFEVLLGTIFNALFFDSQATAAEIAMAGQFAENVYFGKPCGLMDQMASSVGNLVAMDFQDPANPAVEALDFDFSATGYDLCIVDSHASHAELTDAYAAIPAEMGAIAAQFGKNVLREVSPQAFRDRIPRLRRQCGDRAVLRAIHFFHEDARAQAQAQALRRGDFPEFLELVRQSGESSWMYLQNVTQGGTSQAMALTIALCREILAGQGACRIHGGGFAGTALAIVPRSLEETFRAHVDKALGAGSCHILSIRPQGGTELRKL